MSYKMQIALNKTLLSFLLVSCLAASSFAKPTILKNDSSMVQKFYAINPAPLYWFSSENNIKRAGEWIRAIETSDEYGIASDLVQTLQIRSVLASAKQSNDLSNEKTDKQVTSLVLNFIKELQQGNIKFDYDGISVSHDSIYISQLMNSTSKEPVSKIIETMDCKDADYMVLKKYLHDSIQTKTTLKYKTVVLAMNYRRYFNINHHSEYILVNIPTTEAAYYLNGLPVIKMKSVVGMKTNQTPTIASYVTSIVTFPSWNVPHEIAVTEILPKVQKNRNYLKQKDFEVVNAKGIALDESKLKWGKYTERNFPYFFRQATGKGNALGVLKFNLQDPFSIYLHSTNMPSGFSKKFRYLSHGCVRLEKPFELADALLKVKLDRDEFNDSKKDTESKTMMLPAKIPTFLIYMPVTVVGNKVTFLKDVYGLIK